MNPTKNLTSNSGGREQGIGNIYQSAKLTDNTALMKHDPGIGALKAVSEFDQEIASKW